MSSLKGTMGRRGKETNRQLRGFALTQRDLEPHRALLVSLEKDTQKGHHQQNTPRVWHLFASVWVSPGRIYFVGLMEKSFASHGSTAPMLLFLNLHMSTPTCFFSSIRFGVQNTI